MNLKQLSLAALASMALFACSNDESLGGSDENGTTAKRLIIAAGKQSHG